MGLYKFFSCNVEVQYKGYFLSKAMLFTLITTVLTIILPFFIAHRSRGFWLRSQTIYEVPEVQFNYEYLLVVETDDPSQPVVCRDGIESPDDFEEYCAELQVQSNSCEDEDKTCGLEFNANIHLPPGRTVTSLTAILGLQIQFTTVCPLHMQSLAIINQGFPSPPSNLKHIGELQFHQVEHLPCHKHVIDNRYNFTSFVGNKQTKQNEIDYILEQYFKRKVNTVLKTLHSRAHLGHTGAINININILIPEMKIRYTPSFMQEIKWAWPQYLSIAVIFYWIFNRIKRFVFNNRLLMAWEVVPWRKQK